MVFDHIPQEGAAVRMPCQLMIPSYFLENDITSAGLTNTGYGRRSISQDLSRPPAKCTGTDLCTVLITQSTKASNALPVLSVTVHCSIVSLKTHTPQSLIATIYKKLALM